MVTNTQVTLNSKILHLTNRKRAPNVMIHMNGKNNSSNLFRVCPIKHDVGANIFH